MTYVYHIKFPNDILKDHSIELIPKLLLKNFNDWKDSGFWYSKPKVVIGLDGCDFVYNRQTLIATGIKYRKPRIAKRFKTNI